MNKSSMLMIVLLSAVLVPGCDPGDSRQSGCREAVEAGLAAAGQRLPPEAWFDDQPPACHDAAIESWARLLAQQCDPLWAFHAGRNDQPVGEQCASPAFDSAWNLGQMIGELEREQATIKAALQDETMAPHRHRELIHRGIVIERDLPQLQALARFDGLLAPVPVPDAPVSGN